MKGREKHCQWPVNEPVSGGMVAMADLEPLQTNGWGHWHMLSTLLFYWFSFIVKSVLWV